MVRKSSKKIRCASESRLAGLPEVMSIDQVARYLGIGRNTAYAAAARGEIKTISIGRRKLVPRLALERLLSGDTRDGESND
jgi:excisionase family DNA binding protein